jgi:hypothetical protein
MADHVRSYIRSAHIWGMKSEHDYRTSSACGQITGSEELLYAYQPAN